MDTTDSPDTFDQAESTSSGAEIPEAPTPETVRERLDRVHDPELDRSIVELQYVENIAINGGAVTVTFVLPTAWCSPAFAWIMATGIRDEVSALPTVTSVTVCLSDHMHGDEITTGVNQGLAFEAVFKNAEDGIEAVQRKLNKKARFARQYEAIKTLRQAGLAPEQISPLTLADIDLEYRPELAAVQVQNGSLTVTVAREPLADYLKKAQATGLVTDETDRLFADRAGDPLDPDLEAFESTLRDARLAGANIDGQATICEALHESRNGADFN
jgi:metal-sulfur cluster biosynthetic enzyme